LVSEIFHAHVKGRTRQGPLLWSVLVLAKWTERYLQSCSPRALDAQLTL
jgi:hypothetical protein